MYNKARFMQKILSGKAPTYLVKRVSINLYSRNYSRKLNVPMPILDLFKCRGVVWGVEGSGLEAWMKSHKSEVAIT